jgi:hypothetical protein
MRFVGLTLRTVFLLLLVVMTARVASPQSEKLLSAYETPSDLVRTILGAAVCGFLVIQIFRYSRDPADMRKWVVIGLAAVPLVLLCTVVIW